MGRSKKLVRTGNPTQDSVFARLELNRKWLSKVLKQKASNSPATSMPEIELVLLRDLSHGRRVRMWKFLNAAAQKASNNAPSWSPETQAERAKIVAACGYLIKTKCVYRRQPSGELAITDAGYTRLNELESAFSNKLVTG